jgi:hypothetical protein
MKVSCSEVAIMITSSSDRFAEGAMQATRFLADRLPNGLHGVYDLELGAYALLDAPLTFAAAVASCLNARIWAGSGAPQEAADAVRHILLATTSAPSDPLH